LYCRTGKRGGRATAAATSTVQGSTHIAWKGEEVTMRKFLCTHTLPAGAFTLDQVCQISDEAQHDPNVRGYRSFLNLSEGKACCILEANSRDVLVTWFEKMGIPYDSIVPVELEGERGEIEDLRELPVTAGMT
jgi:hypothetical protein